MEESVDDHDPNYIVRKMSWKSTSHVLSALMSHLAAPARRATALFSSLSLGCSAVEGKTEKCSAPYAHVALQSVPP
jgi:hypothetical protein